MDIDRCIAPNKYAVDRPYFDFFAPDICRYKEPIELGDFIIDRTHYKDTCEPSEGALRKPELLLRIRAR